MRPSSITHRSLRWIAPGGAVALAFGLGAYGCLMIPAARNSGPDTGLASASPGTIQSPSPSPSASPTGSISGSVGGGATPSPNPSPTASASGSPNPTATVTIKNFAFSPSTLTISKGTIVTWINQDAESHGASDDALINSTNSFFNTGILNPNASASITFNQTGTFPYECPVHLLEMQATISVQ